MLTNREREVLRLRKEGLTQLDVADRLSISQAAVSSFELNAKKKVEDARRTLHLATHLGIDSHGE